MIATLAVTLDTWRGWQIAELYIRDNILGTEGLVPNEDKVKVIDADIAAELGALPQQPHGGGDDS